MLSPAHNTQLDIVDENDVVVGRESRADIHAQGLLHREVHVWFVTPDREIVFQMRALDKDTFPGLLDATVGGHVELGQSYEEAALREVEEESGLNITADDLTLIGKYRGKAVDSTTGSTNNVFRAIYGYVYQGSLESLRVEAGAAAGFEAVPIAELNGSNKSVESKIISSLLEPTYLNFYQKLANLLQASPVT